MAIDKTERGESALIDLNKEIVQREQEGETARAFFQELLSEGLVFRRASGRIVGKYGEKGFLDGLKNDPFAKRVLEEISASVVRDRALVTLVVVGTRKDDGSVHRYRNIRFFSYSDTRWILEFWYNCEIPDQ
jgi:hypothetical protein